MRVSRGIDAVPGRRLVRIAALACVLFAQACGDSTPAPTPLPPVLTCPAGITLTGVVGGAQTVTYATPIATGGAAPVVTACAPASGSSFPTGVTTVTCTATDARSRQAACSFAVTLQPLRLGVARFVAFGDSVTAGEDGRRLHLRAGFVDPVRAYPAVLHARLNTDFPEQGISVINAGFGGVRVKDDLDRLEDVLQIHAPDVLLLLHGYNDLLNDGAGAAEDVVEALRDCVRIARDRGVRHVFVSTITPPRAPTGPVDRAIDAEAVLRTNAGVAAMAAAEGVHLVDAYGAFAGREAELVEVDGLHLTVLGNQVLAETFYAAIRAAGLTAMFAPR